MSLKRKRTDLTLATKYEIVKLLDQKVSQSEIGRRYGLVQSTISTISKNRSKIKENYESSGNSERKRHRSGKNAQLDDALKEWFQTARQRDIPISGPILQEKAINFAERMNVSDFNASKGWLSRFKTRENIGFKKLHGEKKDADKDAADRWITDVLPELTREYSADDIYNADETGIYYRAIPDSTHVFKNEIASGSKKCKDRITALVCANMSGGDKRRLLIIGKSKDPRCFRGKSLPITYRANKNSWMTGEIFTEWIRDFNCEMCRKKRKVLLLVDNCTAHLKNSADRLSNVRLEFLPPNTTSIIQPCDQGIIKNLKSKYRSEVVRKIISDIDDSNVTASDLAKSLSLLDAVHLLNKAWKSVSCSTIANCFHKAGFAIEESEERDEIDVPAGMTEEEFQEYVNHDNDLQPHHMPTEEEICEEFMGVRESEEDEYEEDNEDEDETTNLPVTSNEVNDALKTIRKYMEENNEEDFQLIYSLEDKCGEIAERAKKQKKITEFINWIP